MQTNFLVIIFSGVSISVMGLLMLVLPETATAFVSRNMECFLTIPPISVASYILVFKYHEQFENTMPQTGELLLKIVQGGFLAGLFFMVMALVSSLLLRWYSLLIT